MNKKDLTNLFNNIKCSIIKFYNRIKNRVSKCFNKKSNINKNEKITSNKEKENLDVIAVKIKKVTVSTKNK